MLNRLWTHGLSTWNWVCDAKVIRDGRFGWFSRGLLCDYEPSDGTLWSTRGERMRCEDFTAAPCWGKDVCASGENKQKNAHCHCLLGRKIFVLILVPVSCTNSRRKGGSYMELKTKVIAFIQKSCFNIIQEYILYTCARQTGEISIACLLGAKCWARSLKIMLIGLETFIILSEEQTNFDTSSAGHWTSSSHDTVQYSTVQFIFRWTVDLLPSTHSDFVWSRAVYCPFCLSVSIAEANIMF